MKADTTIGIIDCFDLRGKGQSHTYYIVGDDIFFSSSKVILAESV